MNYDENIFKEKANRKARKIWLIFALLLSANYGSDVANGLQKADYYIIFLILCWLPIILGEILLRVKGFTTDIYKYDLVIGYGIFYTFVVSTTASPIAFTYILPVTSLLVLYKNRRFMINCGIANSIIIIGSAVYRYMNGFNSATNVKDYQLQLSCIILCYICYVMSIKHLNESDGAMTDSIKADLNRVITTVEQVKQASNSIMDGVTVVRELASENTHGAGVVARSMQQVNENNLHLTDTTASSNEMTAKIKAQVNHVAYLIEKMVLLTATSGKHTEVSSKDLDSLVDTTNNMAALSQEIEMTTNARWTPEHYKGRNYYTTVYRQFVLFPQQSGKLFIEPAQFQMTVNKPVQSADPFDAFFNGGNNVIEIKKPITTPKIAINVNPLPAGKPADFSGGVGEFTVSSSINSKELKTNDAITIKLVISGTGNLKLISNPEIKFPEDFEVYDPKVDNQVRLTREGLTGNRVIEYLAIPRHAGTYKIPGVSFSYFDIRSKSYKTLKTEEYVVNIEKGAGNADQVIANFTNKEDLKVLGEDIRYIKQNEVTLQPKGSFFYGSMSYWLFYIIPALTFIIFFIIYRKQAAENANAAKVRTKKANKVATKRMKLAGKLLSENKKDAFYDEVLKALWGYISDKLNIPVSRLSKDNIEEKLRNHGVSEELIKDFLNALNDCEFARFAPGDENQAMDKVYSSSIEVISKMENSIKH